MHSPSGVIPSALKPRASQVNLASFRSTYSIVCISSQDWATQLPTNRQQIMARAAARGHHVLFIESGYFLPRVLWSLVRKPSWSLARRIFALERVAPGISARKALNLVPFGKRHELSASINARVTALLVRLLTRRMPQPSVLWIYDPTVTHMIGRAGESLTVYDCVDDYAEQADRTRREFVANADRETGLAANLVFTTTKGLYDRHSSRGRAHLVRNVGDFSHFSGSLAEPIAEELRPLNAPIVGFAGNLIPSKVDFDLLEAAASKRPQWTFVLLGPVGPDARASMDRLIRLSNVHVLGERPYLELPRYIAGFDVAVIPYAENDYTRSCFPLKLYEYLAAGKPVVATGVRELAGLSPDVVLVEGTDAFLRAIAEAIAQDTQKNRLRRQNLAAQNTWDHRTSQLLDLVSDELAR
jgi:glycosyltransferase involved in cell wall biosynthesis